MGAWYPHSEVLEGSSLKECEGEGNEGGYTSSRPIRAGEMQGTRKQDKHREDSPFPQGSGE